ncbi:hypothetical protein DSM100685_1939 [Bifidobacterium avesanii]|nr:hypothetical protein DSM100685_1939 [Bifidobacterium avesanii]
MPRNASSRRINPSDNVSKRRSQAGNGTAIFRVETLFSPEKRASVAASFAMPGPKPSHVPDRPAQGQDRTPSGKIIAEHRIGPASESGFSARTLIIPTKIGLPLPAALSVQAAGTRDAFDMAYGIWHMAYGISFRHGIPSAGRHRQRNRDFRACPPAFPGKAQFRCPTSVQCRPADRIHSSPDAADRPSRPMRRTACNRPTHAAGQRKRGGAPPHGKGRLLDRCWRTGRLLGLSDRPVAVYLPPVVAMPSTRYF